MHKNNALKFPISRQLLFPICPYKFDSQFNPVDNKADCLNRIREKSTPSGNFVLPLRAIG
ncbi:hypothetical protein NEIMUCOT_04747 [Neisseria mucosa ATCC 25996]|uniref:Uncharacterized protein n=1 Tax=Neisseria mucosa (strain ATCC 25996 / DSM 4631 / NCTC 10774 / M26) TaxID=546266 RepID=D2ZVV4_NEIM2|nr:hypothetical protein NEIMUCOT_04747 [Neisseria mucosa ATCC 25996]